MLEESRYNGSGAPGVFLEDLLGATAGGHDIPDAVGWKLKWHSDRTSLVTLFHKSPDGPEAILRYMVRRYGRKDVQGRSTASDRSNIPSGRSDRFRVDTTNGELYRLQNTDRSNHSTPRSYVLNRQQWRSQDWTMSNNCRFPVSLPQTRKSRPISRSALYAAVNENQAYSYVYLLPLAYDLNAYVAGRSVGGFGQRRFRRCHFRICFCAGLHY